MINVTSAYLKCSSGLTKSVGCHYCILNIPCNCTITSDYQIMSPRFTGCHQHDSNITVAHPVNLVLLQKFFGDNPINSILPNSTFSQPLNVSLKPFHLYSHEFSSLMVNDKLNHLNLDKMVTAAKEDKLIYSSLAEPLLESNILDDTSSLQFIFSMVALSISAVCFIFICILCRKVKSLSMLLTVNTQLKHASGLPALPSFSYTQPPTTEAPQSVLSQIHENIPNYNTYILLGLTLMAFIYFVKVQRSKLRKPALMLEISTTTTSAMCKVINLPTCLNQCTFISPNPVTLQRVNFTLRPSLIVGWNGFKVKVQNNSHILVPACKIHLDFISAYKFSQILGGMEPIITQLWVAHHNYCIPIDVNSSEPNQSANEEMTALIKRM